MKKNIFIVAMLSLALVSCKKNEKAKTLHSNNENVIAEVATPEVQSQTSLIQETKNNPQTSLALSENHWDFKDVKKGESVEHIYEVTNTGVNPLIISQVKPTCGCTVPEYTKEPIMPGQKGNITLRFDSSAFDGLQNKQVEVYANVETAPIVLTFSANVVK